MHPRVEEITLQGVLHALADPVRLDLLRTLCRGQAAPASCIRCAPCDMPKSSISRHFQILREAGLIRSERRGAMLVNVARDREIEARFPGLLTAILSAADGVADTARARPHAGLESMRP